MNNVKKSMLYLYALSFTPPEKVAELKDLRDELGDDWESALDSALRLMVSFQQARREPDDELVSGLVRVALNADSSPEACRAFQEKMEALARLPGRAKAQNRLHRKRGCRLCETPCRYGYFSLITEPKFDLLQEMLEEKSNQPIQAVWEFTLKHLAEKITDKPWQIRAEHIGNLAYCLVSLATAKSRYRFPEAQMQKFQAMNQAMIRQKKAEGNE